MGGRWHGWQHSVQHTWKEEQGDRGPVTQIRSKIPQDCPSGATELLSSVSGSWKADPLEVVPFSSVKEIGSRELHVSSRADGYL